MEISCGSKMDIFIEGIEKRRIDYKNVRQLIPKRVYVLQQNGIIQICLVIGVLKFEIE